MPTADCGIPRPRHSEESAIDRATAALAGRRVLVTGAHGFIGRHLVADLLAAGAEVHAAVRASPPRTLVAGGHAVTRWYEGDLSYLGTTEDIVRSSKPDVVFHLASRVVGHRELDMVLPMLESNGRAAVNVMTAVERLGGGRVVLAGSVEEPHRADESPRSPYAAAKLAATNYAMLFHKLWDLPVTVLRPAMVYGPSQPDATKLLPYVIARMLDGATPKLGSGTRPIDWVFIDDVCRAFLIAATHPNAPGLVADVGTGVTDTIADTVRMLAALTGYGGPLEFAAVADPPHDLPLVADIGRARDVLGWVAETSLAGGLAQTVQWHLSRREAEGPDRGSELRVQERPSARSTDPHHGR
jgi:UDP-glucose 4-epimerase